MLRSVALISATALLAMTASVKAMDTADLVGRAGFLIGAARHCGVSAARASHIRQWIAANLVAAAEPEQVVYRFNGFIDAASAASSDSAFPIKCGAVTDAFSALEAHIDGGTPATPRVPAKTSARSPR